MKPITLSLHCEFSEDELQAKAQELSQATIELREVEEEKAAVSKEFTDQIKETRSRMSGLAKAYKARGETRLVDCLVRMNQPEPLQKTTIRLDTGEVVKIEAMSDEERQAELFEDAQEEQRLIDDVLARMVRASEPTANAGGFTRDSFDCPPVPPHEDATSGEYEPNDGEDRSGQ